MTATSASTYRSFARRITNGLEPKNWIVLVSVLVGWHADRLAGIGWGLLGATFAAALPVMFIKFGMRRGKWADRHVGVKAQPSDRDDVHRRLSGPRPGRSR